MESKIPKRMIFYWGNDEMSWMRYMTLYSFRKLNPDWVMELYCCRPNDIKQKTWKGSEHQDYFMFKGKNYTEKIKELDIGIKEWELHHPDNDNPKWQKEVSISQKSNFFKWLELSKDGGMYSDMDILYVKPIDELYDEIKNEDTVLVCDNKITFSIGLLASAPNNKFYYDLFMNGFNTVTLKEYQSAGVINMRDMLGKLPGNNNRLLEKIITNYKSCYNFGMERVYPWEWNKMNSVFKELHTTLPEKTIGIHWYAGTEIAQEYNNLLTEDTFSNYNNTFTHFAKKITGI